LWFTAADGRRLFRLFWPLPLAEAYSGATAVLVDEFDATCL
jgi:hypothetical protein